MMQVILVRHAIAQERDRARWPKDSLRPLTAAGIRKFEKAARGLSHYLPRSAALLTSPFVRARDTAQVLKRAAQLRDIADAPDLAQGQPPVRVFELLRRQRAKCVVLVGHEPNLSTLLSSMLGGVARLQFEFKKGGAACVEFEAAIEPGGAKLLWMLPPRVLRSIR